MLYAAPFLALVSLVAADGAAILKNLATINTDTTALKQSVQTWDGQFFSAIPIIAKSVTLLGAINDGTKTAKASAPLSDDETLDIANAVLNLSTNVNATIQVIIDAKPKFTKNNFNGIINGNLKLDKSATDDFGAAVIAKVPEDYKQVSQGLISELDAYFDRGIAAYA